MNIDFPPILPRVLILFIEAIPTIRDTKTRGTANNFKAFINIWPNGDIQSWVKSIQPWTVAKILYASPKTSPIIIWMYSGIFFFINFIAYLFYFLVDDLPIL